MNFWNTKEKIDKVWFELDDIKMKLAQTEELIRLVNESIFDRTAEYYNKSDINRDELFRNFDAFSTICYMINDFVFECIGRIDILTNDSKSNYAQTLLNNKQDLYELVEIFKK